MVTAEKALPRCHPNVLLVLSLKAVEDIEAIPRPNACSLPLPPPPAHPGQSAPSAHCIPHARRPPERSHAPPAAFPTTRLMRSQCTLLWPSLTPRQVLCVEFSTYEHETGRKLHVRVGLRSELLRVARGGRHVRSEVARKARNEDHRVVAGVVAGGPVGPCTSIVVHVCGIVRVSICMVKLG